MREIKVDLKTCPAFPLHQGDVWGGMTLRQYYAAKAMQSYALHPQYGVQQIVRYAFETADAMIKFEQDEVTK